MSALMIVAAGFFCGQAVSDVMAQGVKKAVPKKPPAPQKGGAKPNTDEPPPNPELPDVSFGIAEEIENPPIEPVDVSHVEVVDPDETPQGQQRLAILVATGQKKYEEYYAVIEERRPIALERDSLFVQLNQLAANLNDGLASIGASQQALRMVEQTIPITNGDERQQLINRAANLRTQIQLTERANDLIETSAMKLLPQYQALNLALKPLDDRLKQVWNQINDCRKQWLELRVPQEKYARLEFENLKKVIDDWSLIDGLWPQAHLWAALCAFELGDFDEAKDRVEKADEIRVKVYWSRRKWSQIEAMKGLVAMKHPKIRGRSDVWMKDARQLMDKKTDWETYFILGRARMQKPNQSAMADGDFQFSLKIKPENKILEYYTAVLRTAGDAKFLDIPMGTKQLENLWTKTGKRSWRLSYDLAKAYHAGGDPEKATAQLDESRRLAPRVKHAELTLSQK